MCPFDAINGLVDDQCEIFRKRDCLGSGTIVETAEEEETGERWRNGD
jgi:hypothetical protein